jgi:8-oxo-dGTP pyrophosphatase MutT (NUDIX family)
MEVQNIELHRVVATAIIHKDNKFLIVRRSLDKKVWPGRWTVPGGGLETTDYTNTPPTTENGIWYYALLNTLRREVREEVGLEMGEEIHYLLDLAFIRPDKVPVLTLSFYAPYKSGEVVLNDENIDYKWISVEEAGSYDLIEGIPEEIRMVNKILKTNH